MPSFCANIDNNGGSARMTSAHATISIVDEPAVAALFEYERQTTKKKGETIVTPLAVDKNACIVRR